MEINKLYQIKIENIWGMYDFTWDLHPQVNILIGKNGSGKTTFIHLLYALLDFRVDLLKKYTYRKISIQCNLGELTYQANNRRIALNGHFFDKKEMQETKIAFVSTFDTTLSHKKSTNKLKYLYHKKTALDDYLSKLLNDFISYQLDIYKPQNLPYSENSLPEQDKKIGENKLYLFFTILNEIFDSKYRITNDEHNISVFHLQNAEKIEHQDLSSGEKQLLIILLQALLTKNQPFILLLDEPELSLHLSIQEKLIAYIKQLNEQIQLIIVTHSPSMIRKGYMDAYIEIETLKTYAK